MHFRRLSLLGITLSLLALLLSGCGMRPQGVVRAPEAVSTPAPTEAVTYTVAFRNGDNLLKEQKLPFGGSAVPPEISGGVRLLGWLDENGERIVPEEETVTRDRVYTALTRPAAAEGALFLFPDANGLLRPEDPFTREDAQRALNALFPELWPMQDLPEETAKEPLPAGEFVDELQSLFDPDMAASIALAVLPEGAERVTRRQAAEILAGSLGPIEPPEGGYYPDVSPYIGGADALLRAAGVGPLTPEALAAQAKDGFVWFDGCLYCLDEEGYFRTEEYGGLTFDGNGRFTSGSAELDAYVAQTLKEYTKPENPRLEDLRAVYYHVKNDFQYLTRNYYASGETGWENAEALTLFETGKGNCYCYAGVFRSLARGLGYNAVCYSGTMGNQDQPHAWTEITLDGSVYICDPEIEMNYWWLAGLNNDPSMYTDNFMMLRESSVGWNYQAVGRVVHYG